MFLLSSALHELCLSSVSSIRRVFLFVFTVKLNGKCPWPRKCLYFPFFFNGYRRIDLLSCVKRLFSRVVLLVHRGNAAFLSFTLLKLFYIFTYISPVGMIKAMHACPPAHTLQNKRKLS